ncbi:MAG: tetraacyldisaccharide 4'-kinase [Planctomycetota bacterium]|nr:tetraacyldisaccharide 4'-kinase [Planctomycetota bacterium]
MSGPLPGYLLPLTRPASFLYGLAIAARNRRYDRGAGVQRIDVPVISVGNIAVGGTGKSPFVRHLARLLIEHGRRPVIAMRGYRAAPGEASDEQAEHEALLPEIDVLAQPDRLAALRRYLPRHPEIDCVLLDDGFQHRRLHRDLDLVLIDAPCALPGAGAGPGARLLPAGWLREPLSSLRRADAVIVTHAREIDEALARRIEADHGRPPVAWTRHTWAGLTVHDPTGGARDAGVGWLEGRRVLTMLGVARPQAILDQLAEAGATVAVTVPAGDHERYTRKALERVRRLAEGVEAVVLTGKDWVKVRRLIDLATWPAPLVVPEPAIEFLEGRAALDDLVLTTVAPSAA